MNEIKAPNPQDLRGLSIFLAGSIEMGAAEKWQDRVAKSFANFPGVTLLNPRRDDWDSSWVQDISNPQFREQVEWELKGIKDVDIVLFYFDPNTKSPITLLELGLVLASRKLTYVVCPFGFYRKGNVDVTCNFYSVTVYNDLDLALDMLKMNLVI